jgi:uncharacterized protein (TIGR03067 family)
MSLMNANPEDPRRQSLSSGDAPAAAIPAAQAGQAASAAPRGPESGFQKGSVRLFHVAGIDVLLHWSWFCFAFLRLQPTATDAPLEFAHYDSPVWYVVEYLALFGFVLLHEFGHVLACRSVGGIADCIVLWPLGGIALVDPPARPGPVLWSIAAGPLVNALLVAPTAGFWLLCRAAGAAEAAPDLYRFAVALAWINGYLLVFNILPVYPLDGGRVLHALLWLLLGRARGLMGATVVGLSTALVLLVVASVERSLLWGIIAGFGVLFSLVGLQGARALIRMRAAPRRKEAACPGCGVLPPLGKFWACLRCWVPFDVFENGGNCPNCSTPLTAVSCPECGLSRPYAAWQPGITPSAALNPPWAPAAPPPPPTVRQRVVWAVLFGFCALALCGLPNSVTQPLGLLVWTAGGVMLGVLSAGTMTRAVHSSQALRKLRDTWRLVEVDGQGIAGGAADARRLILSSASYEERIGDKSDVRGTCWFDPLAEPPAISLTPKTGPEADKPRQGIYRLEGATLTVCLAYPGHPRPTAFVSQPEVQQVRRYRRGKTWA